MYNHHQKIMPSTLMHRVKPHGRGIFKIRDLRQQGDSQVQPRILSPTPRVSELIMIKHM